MIYPQTEKQLLLKEYFRQMVQHDVPVYEDILARVLQTDVRVLREITQSRWYE